MNKAFIAAVFCLPLALSGCMLQTTAPPSADAGLAVSGRVHGGQQPIVGAHVYLFAANTNGNAGPGIASSSSNASNSLLHSTGYSDSIGSYVLSGTGGVFTITAANYSCTPNTQVYLYALGGDAGDGPNSLAGLMAVLGNCPSAGNFIQATPYVVINEVSTIAAAYAFAGFASDATHVSSSSTALALTGIQNAFANAANLADLSSGAALTTTPAGNGIAPQATVYNLADILASCINSNGALTALPTPTGCYTLFQSATSDGTPSGKQAGDTATAAIYIAHNPGANVGTLTGLIAAQSPFYPTLLDVPSDYTLAVQYSGGGLNAPSAIAIDASGDAWIANNGSSSVTEYSPNGTALSTAAGYTAGGMDGVVGIAIDPAGNAWVANDLATGGSIIELNSSGALAGTSPYTSGIGVPYDIAVDASGAAWVTNNDNGSGSATINDSVTKLLNTGMPAANSPFTLGGLNEPQTLAIDASGNAWIANANNSITELSNSGTAALLSPYSASLNSPSGIAIDHSGNVWIANAGGDNISEISASGQVVSGSPFSGNLTQPVGIAIDGSGNIWTANELGGSVAEFNSAGALVSGYSGYGYNDGSIDLPDAIAIDGSGNVWIANLSGTGAAQNNGSITELIGAATPVVAPLSLGVANNALGVRP